MKLKMFQFLIILSIFYYVQANDENTLESRIIGGKIARTGQFPFTVAIYVQTNTSKFFCGGALTNNDWVITAGHCVYNANIFTLQLGSNLLESDDPNRLTVATSTYFLHPDFKPDSIENDIGLIKFRRPIDYTEYLLSIPIKQDILEDDSYAQFVGWGQTSDNDSKTSNELRYVTVSTISNLECQLYYGNQINENMVCAVGNYNEGPCIGDNGGPLFVINGRYYSLVGISSFLSANGCESTDPSGYTRVFPYLDWIKNITSE